MRVKDVPIFYLPAMYYPIQATIAPPASCCRSTVDLVIQGQSLNNAFFWAMNRSQDLTLITTVHPDRPGLRQRYRWMRSPSTLGNLRAYKLAQKAATVNGGRCRNRRHSLRPQRRR